MVEMLAELLLEAETTGSNNFLLAGGHSPGCCLPAAGRARVGSRVGVDEVFANPTLEELADRIGANGGSRTG